MTAALFAAGADVFRQARASGLVAALILAAVLSTAVCLSARYAPDSGQLTVAGGWDAGAGGDAVSHFLAKFVAGAADTLGLTAALVWTSGFLPGFLEPASASLLLSKPVPRVGLFLGRWLAVTLLMALAGAAAVAGAWLGLVISTGVRPPFPWAAVPILTTHFAVFFGVSALLAVVSRSAAVCMVGTLIFLSACYAANVARHLLIAADLPEAANAVGVADFVYWFLPKPADFGVVLHDLIAGSAEVDLPGLAAARAAGQFRPLLSLGTSAAFGAAALVLALYEFRETDY